MPSGEKTLSSHVAGTVADLNKNFVSSYWRFVEICLREVFHETSVEADNAVATIRKRLEKLPDDRALLLYHDSPLQTAATLAGAANRPLTPEELLTYEELLNKNRPKSERPSRDQILQAHTSSPKIG